MKKIKEWREVYNKDTSLKQHLGSLYTHSLLFEEIRAKGPARVLEVGTGSGIMSIFLSLMGYAVTAIDNDPGVLDAAGELNARFGAKVEYTLADAFDLSGASKNRKFDLAFSQGFFEHFDDAAIKRLLDEQLALADKVLISVPSVYYPVRDFGNERLLSCRAWRDMLRGYDIESMRYYGIFLPDKKRLVSGLFNPVFCFKTAFSGLIRESSHILIKIKK